MVKGLPRRAVARMTPDSIQTFPSLAPVFVEAVLLGGSRVWLRAWDSWAIPCKHIALHLVSGTP